MPDKLVLGDFILKKMAGKGGWTYVELPSLPQNTKRAFGMIKVKGQIDTYSIKQFNIMPMGNGNLFLPVKAEIRKAIKKQEGDTVSVSLELDNDPVEIPEEFLLCLLESPHAHEFFFTLTETNQNSYLDYIYVAKRIETRVNRIAKTIVRLEKGLRSYDLENP